MKINDIKDLSEQVQKAQNSDRLFMSFSTGADSIAMFLRCLESGKWDMSKAVLFYYYLLPDIPWVEDYLEYFQEKYNVKIIQVESAIILDDLAKWHYQTPARAWAINELYRIDPQHAPFLMKKEEITMAVRVWAKLPDSTYCAIGTKCGDSAIRRKYMYEKQGIAHNNNKWFPIWDFENTDVIKYIKSHDVKVPYDYELFGISFENIDYRFSKVIKERCPETWKKAKDFYPLIESIITRYEFYHPDWKCKKGIKNQKFGGQVLQPRRPL